MQSLAIRYHDLAQGLKSLWDEGPKSRALLLGDGLLLGFILINLVILAVFAGRTYPNTRIANQSVGAASYSALTQKANRSSLLPKTIALKQQGQAVSVSPSQLGIGVDSTKLLTEAKQRSWLPIANFFTSHAVILPLKVDQTILNHKLAELAAQQQQKPVDARIIIQNNSFALAGSSKGRQLNLAQAPRAVKQALATGKSELDLPMKGTAPAVSDASLKARLQQLQAQQAVALNFTYDKTSAKPSAATIISWYAPLNGDYVLQDSVIRAYITQAGTTSHIRVQNLDAAVAATKQALESASPLNFALVAVPPGPCSSNSIKQLVVVSLSQQHLWACESFNQVYETAITSGAYIVGNGTPTGTWHIYGKSTNLHLTGPTWDDPVAYWLPFYADYGFHDSSWQSFPYGDPVYATDGSHGCIHLPLAAMAWLYNWSHIGTTVTIKA